MRCSLRKGHNFPKGCGGLAASSDYLCRFYSGELCTAAMNAGPVIDTEIMGDDDGANSFRGALREILALAVRSRAHGFQGRSGPYRGSGHARQGDPAYKLLPLLE